MTIRKTVTITIPNEPFTTDVSEGKTCDITYTGCRYLVISIDPSNNRVQSQEGMFDAVAEYERQVWEDDRFEYHLIDAEKHPVMAAFLSMAYENENIPNYEQTFQDLDGNDHTWTYDYADDTGILDNIFERWGDYTYDPDTDTFSDFVFVDPPISEADFDASVQRTIDRIDSIDRSIQTDAINAELDTFREHFVNLRTNFPGIAGYKLPWPNEPFWDDSNQV